MLAFSAANLCSTLAKADDRLPKGTAIQLPGEQIIMLSDSAFLLSRSEIIKVVVMKEDFARCNAALLDCQHKHVANPTPSFWSSSRGHGILIGGFSVSVSAAFIGGIYVESKVKR